MRKRLFCLALSLILTVSCFGTVFAFEHGMTDIVGHWAEEDIAWVIRMGLFNGTSATTFFPGGTMTRGMFVTVLGRYAGIDPNDFEDWYLPELYEDVDADIYYAPYINWATRHGIASGTSADHFSPDSPITREQMAVFLYRFSKIYGYRFEPIREVVAPGFDDASSISGYAAEAVDVMRQCGLLTGRSNSQGGFDFDPQDNTSRAECAAVFHRLMSALVIDENAMFIEPESITVSDYYEELLPGDSFKLTCEVYPENSSNPFILWISTDPAVASVASDGTVTCHGNGSTEIYAYTCNGLFDYRVIEINSYIGYDGESYASKCMHLFGEVVDDHRYPYGTDAPKSAYEEHYEYVTVKTWDFKDSSRTEKITRTHTFYVHKNLVATVKLCFQEIYECDAQYPIRSIVTYWAGGKSEHNAGTAIDINPEENPYVAPDGTVLVGTGFDPENNPYSIPIDGEIQQIFEKYGFTRGIYWRSGYKDYMHFSFFGT